MKKLILGSIVSASLLLSACASAANAVPFEEIKDDLSVADFRSYGETSPTTVSTRIGELSFTKGGFAGGYPTLETIDKLRDELDFQKATQAYIWAVPLISYAEWFSVHEEVFHAKDGQIVQNSTYKSKQGILTANATTLYAIVFTDLTRTGPLVLDVPAGPSAGVIDDMFQRGVGEFGVSAHDAGEGVRLSLN